MPPLVVLKSPLRCALVGTVTLVSRPPPAATARPRRRRTRTLSNGSSGRLPGAELITAVLGKRRRRQVEGSGVSNIVAEKLKG